MARTRVLAAGLVSAGHVRVNGRKVDQPSRAIAPGDVLTISLQRDVRVLRVIALAERRGPYEEARLLYEDLNAAPPEIGRGRASGIEIAPRQRQPRRSLVAFR